MLLYVQLNEHTSLDGCVLQCCAVSFIENLTAENLNMDPDEFDQFMSGQIIAPSTWESALIMCEVKWSHTRDIVANVSFIIVQSVKL